MNKEVNNLVGGFTCVATVNGTICGKEEVAAVNLPDLSFDLYLCEPHRAELYNRSDIAYRAKEDARAHRYGDAQSFVYVVQLADQTVKIGYTTSLCHRLQDISRYYNKGTPVKVLAVLEGDQHLEGQLHWEWQDARIWDSFGERHHPTPDLMSWIDGLEISPAARNDLVKFSTWRPAPARVKKVHLFDWESEEEKGQKELKRIKDQEAREKKMLEERPSRLAEYVAAQKISQGEVA